MVVAGACISGVAHVSDHLSLVYKVAFSETSGVVREVRVVKDQFLIGTELIDRRAAAFALKEPLNLAVTSGKDGSFSGCGNIDGIVYAAFGTCGVKGVDQLFRSDAGNWDDEICCADKVRG